MRDVNPIMLEKRINELEKNGGGGSSDYENLENKPKIENVELVGNKTFEDLGIASAEDLAQTVEDLQEVAEDCSNNTIAINENHAAIATITDNLNGFMMREVDGKAEYKLESEGADAWRPFSQGGGAELIWVNPNPHAELNPFEIPFDNSKYSHYMIYGNSSPTYYGGKNAGGTVIYEKNKLIECYMGLGHSNDNYRQITINENSISVGKGFWYTDRYGKNDDNTRGLLQYIIGFNIE